MIANTVLGQRGISTNIGTPSVPTSWNLFGFCNDSRFAYYSAPTTNPSVMVVDRLTSSYTDGEADTTSGNNIDYRGSLAYCLRQSFPRVIMFETSGTIDMRSTQYLLLDNDYSSTTGRCIVAGQTAPSPGILVTGTTMWIDKVSDVLFQHITFEMGDRSTTISNADDKDTVSVTYDVPSTNNRIMFDRCTFRWGTDETLSGSANDYAISRSLIYESMARHETAKKDNTFHPSLSVFYNPTSIYRSVFAYGYDRCPWVWPSVDGDEFAIINNVFWNAYRTGPMIGNPLEFISMKLAMVGNWIYRFTDEAYTFDEYAAQLRNDGYWDTDSELFMDDNLCKRTDDGFSEWEAMYNRSLHTPGNETSSPFSLSQFDIIAASQVKESVLAEAGSRFRDAHDVRILDGIENDSMGDRDWYLDSPQSLPARAVNWSSSLGLFQSGTSTLISFSGDVITETTGQFNADDVSVGQLITVNGSTSNDGTYTVTGKTAGTITCSGAGFTTEGTGASITLVSGWDWSATSQSFTIEVNNDGGNSVTLNASCVGTAQIISHINSRLSAAGVNGAEAYAIWDYPAGTGGVGIRTTASGSSQEIVITSSTATGIDLVNGTYTGQNAISGGYLTRTVNTHELDVPDNPHTVDGTLTNLEIYILGFTQAPVEV